jgi:hypothetical protein
MKQKRIIQRNLPLNIKYTLIDKQYIPLENNPGICCNNCGKIICNIATIKNEIGESFDIGFDCLDTILLNNQILDGNSLKDYEHVKKMIPKILRFSKHVKETAELNRQNNLNLIGLRFEKQTYPSEYFTFYYLFDKARPYNSYVKLKDMDFDFLIETIKNIFPKFNIEIL